jgi:hypothetical protein
MERGRAMGTVTVRVTVRVKVTGRVTVLREPWSRLPVAVRQTQVS